MIGKTARRNMEYEMMKKILIVGLLLVGGFFATPCAAAGRAVPARPHIVFILADDLGYGDIGCYGCADIKTPNIDRLAADGMRFSAAYANGAVCSPTRAAFLTARYQQRLGLDNALTYQEMGRGLPEDGTTIAHALKAAGYTTLLSGKWHLGYDPGRQPNAQGFDRFFGLLGGNHHYFEHMDRIGVPDLFLDRDAVEMEGYSTDLITDHAIRFLREKTPEQPVFLYLSYNAPHFPWQGPDDAGKIVQPKKKSWQLGDRQTYVAMVESMDAGIGKVLQELDLLGMRNNTLVVFASDNGGHTWSSNAPLRGEKATLWEGGIRVPCVARWPGIISAGSETDQPNITMDWSTTFLRLAHVPPLKDGEDGIDLTPVLKTGKPLPGERTLFWRRKIGPRRKNVEEGRAVRQGRWKLIDPADAKPMLFDLVADLAESQDVSDRYPEKVSKLVSALDTWEKKVCE